jgi:FKBP-type peptidyl-prolyl cis-trans isomerase FkpA
MSKKEILVVLVILIFIGGLSVGGYFVWRHYHVWKVSVVNKLSAVAATPPSDNISLQESAPAASNTGGLSVDTSTNTNNPAQLGSGQSKTSASSSNSSSSSSSASAPGPETFAQYDQYKTAQNALFGDIKVGTGSEVKAGSKVAIYYKGWLTNGTLFDQSKAGSDGKMQPLIFTLGKHEVITGMEQDMVGMKVGGSRRMIIPPAAGYGAQAQGPIPANSVLVFDVELLDMQ